MDSMDMDSMDMDMDSMDIDKGMYIIMRVINSEVVARIMLSRYCYTPPRIGGGIKRCFCLTSICRVHRA